MEPQSTHPRHWVGQIFSAQAVLKGGIVRRNRNWIAQEIGLDAFQAEVRARGYRLVEVGEQWVVVCSRSPLRILV